MPSDPWQELQAISIMSWYASGMHPFLSRINSPAKVCDLPGAETSVKKLATAPLFESFTIADDLLKGREWFFDHFTAADAHFYWVFRRAGHLEVDVSGFANCTAHFERMGARPSVQKVLAYEKSVLAEFATAA
jgi:glutathione S-transferase